MAVSNQPPRRHSLSHFRSVPENPSDSSSMRDLLQSLSKEQLQNQELLVSLVFALRSFTNLNRFLELIPVLVSRLIGAGGSLLVPFHIDGRLWREQLQLIPLDKYPELIRQLLAFEPGKISGFANDDEKTLEMDQLVQRQLQGMGVFATSLVSRGKHRGRLYVFEPKGPLICSEFHRRYIQLVADLTAVAIENDSILKEIRLHERVDRQLSTGAEIQSQLLPDHCPVIEGIELAAKCRPAFQVGGDYYDFMPTRPELIGSRRQRARWALVIGDVMGKGVPAGLLMTMLRGMLRAEVLSGLPPDRILHDLNQLAQEDLSYSHRFVTLFYSDYDPKTKRLRYANAAHNPPLIWRSEQRCVSRLDAPGLLIGLQQEAEYGSGEIFLAPGDVILYYTDGVTEASGISGNRFDEARLILALEENCRSGLGAQEILDQLFNKLDRFVGGGDRQLEDDASMVVLKVPEAIRLPSVSNSLA